MEGIFEYLKNAVNSQVIRTEVCLSVKHVKMHFLLFCNIPTPTLICQLVVCCFVPEGHLVIEKLLEIWEEHR